MKILLTGATGYIGKRLLPELLEQGHEVICCVRDRKRFPSEGVYTHPDISLFEIDFLQETPSSAAIKDVDAAYYLIHSMSLKLPGEAWLEFRIVKKDDGKHYLQQTATFRPRGVSGRAYWYSVLPFHFFVFNGMAENIIKVPAVQPVEETS